MYAFNNYCPVCDKLIPNCSPSKLSRTNSTSSDKSTDKLYCSHECERKDKLNIVNSTILASNDIGDSTGAIHDELDEVTSVISDQGMMALDEPLQNQPDYSGDDSHIVPDHLPAVLASPASFSHSLGNDHEDFPSITITTVTGDITSKTTLDEREQLLASPFLLPLSSNNEKNSLFEMNEHIDNSLTLGESLIPHYYNIPPLNSFYNIPKTLFIGSNSKTSQENCSFDHTAETNYKLWLSNNIP
ncbi:similar to Saccharomyces cerevisiae YGR146C ECL1 Protein of unknown function, affects chronological lifespan [Maudiozyma barnettii]|uniref:Uncharacterized protein n=1 Tax=Maudiozyma barnettii TaxID=61262 RepID=A0A8H2ZK98_9SACH|nr:uncharacterized protein KABA2_11S02640 [Kazachstania barnettii]CAB4256758.1 similar to Saccharomyces cerevisiae YGR146C ECL1 Protein of unknown function, affects chronological lifespan [Kazachstania barnettii]CAD1785411.1 similar to Saccharomyces cerevisiae YGR146C ECL1 Protein of unknown function, affects chronological lifespan [Kazachstania barnettii]